MNNPFEIFAEWFEQAKQSGMKEPTAFNLATATADGKPSNRILLLKNYDERGFVFYTNSNSRKGGELDSNPYISICFYWMELEKQVRIEGKVEKVSKEEADEYYNSRALGKRIGAWASKQSEVLPNRDELMNRVAEFEEKFGENPERPEHWNGYRLVPSRIEFWQEGELRLHDRQVFERQSPTDSWQDHKLYP